MKARGEEEEERMGEGEERRGGGGEGVSRRGGGGGGEGRRRRGGGGGGEEELEGTWKRSSSRMMPFLTSAGYLDLTRHQEYSNCASDDTWGGE